MIGNTILFIVLAASGLISAGVVIYRLMPEPDPQYTIEGAACAIADLSDKILAVRKKILCSNLLDADRLAMADELLFLSDEIKSSSNRLIAAALTEAAMRPQMGVFPWY